MSYSMSTNSNPFCQGGWQPHMTIEQSPTWFNTTNDSQPAYSDLPGPTSAGVRELSSTFSAIDSNSTTLTTPATPRSTTYRLIPSPSNSSSVNGHTSYALLSPNNRIMYTIASVGPCLTLVKDSRGRPTALLESSANPCVDIRGGRGKKRVDEWLMHDITNPCLRFMSWGGEWYYWAIVDNNTYLYQWNDYEFQYLGEVRPWGLMFEIEMTSMALKKHLLEPSLVALMIIRQDTHFTFTL